MRKLYFKQALKEAYHASLMSIPIAFGIALTLLILRFMQQYLDMTFIIITTCLLILVSFPFHGFITGLITNPKDYRKKFN